VTLIASRTLQNASTGIFDIGSILKVIYIYIYISCPEYQISMRYALMSSVIGHGEFGVDIVEYS
jgi:hypothetical protein